MVAADARRTEGLRSVVEAGEQAGVPLAFVDRAALDDLRVADHQGVVAEVVLAKEMDERALLRTVDDRNGLLVVLDGITDPQNFGAAARSAEAAGAIALVARRRRAAPLSAAALRASAGALLHLPMARVASLARTLDRLKDLGYTVVGLDQGAETTIRDRPPPGRPLAVVIGAEDAGISRLVRESCDFLVSIPMAGRTASLNASAALAVALFGYALPPEPGP
jgi:23S rRNA (guanosine2251-2'-O)-methyltransferase